MAKKKSPAPAQTAADTDEKKFVEAIHAEFKDGGLVSNDEMVSEIADALRMYRRSAEPESLEPVIDALRKVRSDLAQIASKCGDRVAAMALETATANLSLQAERLDEIRKGGRFELGPRYHGVQASEPEPRRTLILFDPLGLPGDKTRALAQLRNAARDVIYLARRAHPGWKNRWVLDTSSRDVLRAALMPVRNEDVLLVNAVRRVSELTPGHTLLNSDMQFLAQQCGMEEFFLKKMNEGEPR